MGKTITKGESRGIARGTLGPSLNLRQRAFVREVAGRPLHGLPLKHAYARAGYSAKSEGGPQRLLENPRIQHEIRQLERKKAIEAGARLEAVIFAQCRKAFANLGDFVELDDQRRMKLVGGLPVLRSDIGYEQLEAIAKFSLSEKGVTFDVDTWPALKALREFLAPNKSKIELTGAEEGPVQIDLKKLTDADLAVLERIIESATHADPASGGSGPADSNENGAAA
jgi:hypothetical protein